MIVRIEVAADTMDDIAAMNLRLAGFTIKEHVNRKGAFPYIDKYICQKIVEPEPDIFSNKMLWEYVHKSAGKKIRDLFGGKEQ